MARTKQEVRNWLNAQVGKQVNANAGIYSGMCVSLVKALLEYLGAPNPYKARGHAKDYADTLVREGIAKDGNGWLRVVVNRNMGKIGGVTYGHIWIDLANEANYEQNGAIALRTTKNTRPYSQRQQVVNLDRYIKGGTPVKKSNETIAREVLDGKWGNGPTRIAKLKAAGYDYNAIQRIVNDLVAGKPVAKYHTVKKGDTMSGIAAKYKISLGRLIQLNPQIKNINVISVGQKVRVK